jgi:NodT family efflux transporter outer membrane factor (OMF) lipoprotein
LLPQLVQQAQQQHPSLALALARLQEARAGTQAARGGLWPVVNAGAQASRAATVTLPARVLSTQASVGVDAAWEIDLFGGQQAALQAAQAREQQGAAGWHDARVSLAADVAQAYVGLRACQALLAVLDQEARSQARTAELTQLKVKAGLDAPANGALAEAGAADAANRQVAQQADCEAGVKLLVLLTGADEPALRTQLQATTGRLPQPRSFDVGMLPAQLLTQRPDLAAAQLEHPAAAADVAGAQAARWPRLSLAGNLAQASVRSGGLTVDGIGFGFGPTLSLPLFDAGRRAAAVDAAQARYEAARAGLQLKLAGAVRETEEALLRLDAAARREADARRAAEGFVGYYNAAQERWRLGAGSLIEMEDARRVALGAQAGLIGVQRERVAAWITLYKALGGGWQAGDPAPGSDKSQQPTR